MNVVMFSERGVMRQGVGVGIGLSIVMLNVCTDFREKLALREHKRKMRACPSPQLQKQRLMTSSGPRPQDLVAP